MTASVPETSNQKEGRSAPRKFPRTARLLRHADFERVYKQGKRHFSASMTVFYLARSQAGGIRVGFTVGRALGGAVQRNRMKRRLREAVRLTRPVPGPNTDVVINPKKTVLTVEFAALISEMRRAFEVVEKNNPGSRAQRSTPES